MNLEMDHQGHLSKELCDKLMGTGVQALEIPEELGGSGADAMTACVVFEEMAKYDAGSDASAVKSTAVRDGDEYILNGTKCFITNGGVADI